MKNLWPLSLMLFAMLFMSVGVPAQAHDGGKSGKSMKGTAGQIIGVV